MSSNVRDPNIQIKERNSEFDLLSHYSYLYSRILLYYKENNLTWRKTQYIFCIHARI